MRSLREKFWRKMQDKQSPMINTYFSLLFIHTWPFLYVQVDISLCKIMKKVLQQKENSDTEQYLHKYKHGKAKLPAVR